MRYGYFDDLNREYVIERADTPKSWSNYLGSTEYGAIITNNAGGYSFFHSAARGRFMRLRYNSVPMDQPGRYVYVRDRDSEEYWSSSWQPVGKPRRLFKSECRHGTAYTVITSEYKRIKTETAYFVPLGRHFECWRMKVTNNDDKKRRMSFFTYVEYAGHWHMWNDLVNLQYSQYTVKMDAVGDTDKNEMIIDHGVNVFIPPSDDFNREPQCRHSFLTVIGGEIKGFDTDREAFLGPYRTYANPLAVEKGRCSGSLAAGDNGCGTIHVDMDLEPGETRELTVLMGIGSAGVEGKAARELFSKEGKVDEELDKLKRHWHSRLQGLTVETPDKELNSMMNVWNPFNSMITYAWSRAASLVYSGERDGLGYRDTVQDMLGVIHNIPGEAGERLELMLTGQCSTGGAMPVVQPFAHKPGHEKKPDEKDYRSDDCLWLFNTVPAYVKETGDLDFYHKVLPYADEGEDTVLGHLRRAICFNLDRMGDHGLPCGLFADWNDCLELGYRGESFFVAFQLRYALKTYIEICTELDKKDEIKWAEAHLDTLDTQINRHGWDGQWYLRAFRDDGFAFGGGDSAEGKIFLNSQSWSIISGHADRAKGERAMESVNRHLTTEYGIMLCDPFEKTDFTVVKATLFNKSMKENGSIFSHAQGWAIMAETMLGHGNRAYEYLRAFMPAAYNDRAGLREIEPYVYCQSTHGKYSPRFGASRVPWLTGTASWAYYVTMHYVLGLKPGYGGLHIDPCIPSHWKTFSAKRVFRNKILNIRVFNETGNESGVEKILLNGEPLDGNFISFGRMRDTNDVRVWMR